jgi:uncharacterized Zn finger protein (UPF0148 family)
MQYSDFPLIVLEANPMDQHLCPECGVTISEESVSCPYCGARMAEREEDHEGISEPAGRTHEPAGPVKPK